MERGRDGGGVGKGALLHATFVQQMCSVLSGSKMPWLKSKVLRINYWNEEKEMPMSICFFIAS